MTREEMIALAKECKFSSQNDTFFIADTEEIQKFFHAAQRQAYERAAAIAEENLADEPYGHAAFRCVSISNAIRALIVQKPSGA